MPPPADPKRVEKLRRQWDKAIEKDRPKDAIAALIELEQLDPDEARWSQRLGDLHRRIGQGAQAERAYERAMRTYARLGFLPRALAMAKMVVALNPAREAIVAEVDAAAAQALRPPPSRPVHGVEAAVSLHRVPAAKDEVRFDDAPADALAVPITLEELVEEEAEEIEELADEDLILEDEPPSRRAAEGPSAEQLAKMAACALFADLSAEARAELAAAAQLVELAEGGVLFRRNDRADALFALVSGAARVTLTGGDVEVGEGDILGESCLLDLGIRQADVTATAGGLVALRISVDALRAIGRSHPELPRALFELLVRRLIANLLQGAELFQAFDPATRLEIARMFEVRRASAGVVLAERGKRYDGLYVVLAGHLSAEIDEPGAESPVRLSRGTTFGHAALLSHSPAAETVTAVTESVVLRLPAARFGAFAAMYPPALVHLSDAASRPLKTSVPPPCPEGGRGSMRPGRPS